MVVDHMSTGSEHTFSDSAASPSEESYLRPTNASAGPEGSGLHNESTIAQDTEVTEGGWICRVERMGNRFDNTPRNSYHHKGFEFTRRNSYEREGVRIKMQKDELQDDRVEEESVQQDRAQEPK